MTGSEDNTTTPAAELRAMDEALAFGAVSSADPHERELQELALALQAEAEEPSAQFGAELRGRVRGGFPRERRLPRLRLPGRPRLRRPALPVLGGVASLLVGVAVAVSLIDQGGDDHAGGGDAAVQSPLAPEGAVQKLEGRGRARAGKDLAGTQAAPAPGIPPQPPPGSGGFAPGERERRIERSASLTLAAPGERLDRVADGVVRLTERHEGFVLRSSLSTGDEGTTGGDFELRIPADRLGAAVTGLSKLADVRARTQEGRDVTPQLVSAEDRLQAARAERRSLLRRLERAPSDSAVESIRRRLDLNAGEIRGLRGQVRELRTRTNYASVTVTLQAEDGDGGSSSPGAGEGLGGALDDALHSLSDSVEIAIRALGLILPLALLGGGLTLAARSVRRRQREAALG